MRTYGDDSSLRGRGGCMYRGPSQTERAGSVMTAEQAGRSGRALTGVMAELVLSMLAAANSGG